MNILHHLLMKMRNLRGVTRRRGPRTKALAVLRCRSGRTRSRKTAFSSAFCIDLLLVFCFSLLLTACGFHLQGTTLIPSTLHTLYLESDAPYSSLTKNLRFSLESNKIKLVAEPKEAPFTLAISNEQQNMQAVGNAGDQQTHIYMLKDSVTISLIKSDHTIIVQPVLVSASRNFSLPAGTIASNSPVLTTTTEQTQAALIQNILAKLSSNDFSDAIEGKKAGAIHTESKKQTAQCTGYVSNAS